MYHGAHLATLVCESPAERPEERAGLPMRARWRDPRVAPVYAAVVAFAVVGVFGLVSGHHSSTIPEVRLVAAGVANLPPELDGRPIEVWEPGGTTPVATGQFTKGSYAPATAVSGRLLCVQLPAHWSLAGATDGCVTAPEPKSGQVTLTASKAVLVTVKFAPENQAAMQDVVVTVRDPADPTQWESGPLDKTGTYQPKRSLAKQQVCLAMPADYQVSDQQTTEQGGLTCTNQLADRNQDLTLTLTPKRGAR
jgi:hypothetical protein